MLTARLTKEEIEKCKELLKSGMKYFEVAEEVGVNDEDVIVKDVSEWRIRYNNRSVWTDENERVVKEMLRDGMHPVEIARKVDICPEKIGDKNRAGWKIPVRPRTNASGVSSRDPRIESEVCRLYQLGLSRSLINAELGYHFSTDKSITDIVKKYGYDPSSMNRRNLWDEHYFDFIDTEGKAYFLGLWAADGWIHNRDGILNIGISLENSDRYIVEKFLEEINCDNKIVDKESKKPGSGSVTHSAQIILASNVMGKSMKRYGITERKTKTLRINPNGIPHELMHHFIRGMIDGDGSVHLGSANNLTFNLVGTKDVVDFVNYYFWISGLASFASLYFPKGYSFPLASISYASEQEVSNIYNFLTTDMTIYMKRKWHPAQDWFNQREIEVNQIASIVT